ncbi:MAG: dihydroorotate dehydrogenase (quinone), partial [Pseudomonadota bacterium]
LTDGEISEIADVAISAGLHAIIATNTTLSRDGLQNRHRDENGGLSGQPLMQKSTRVLARLAVETRGKIPLVGVGGVSTAQDAMTKIRAGASAVQLYSAMVYEGISLAPRIARGLDRLLEEAGFANVADAVGVDAHIWAE